MSAALPVSWKRIADVSTAVSRLAERPVELVMAASSDDLAAPLCQHLAAGAQTTPLLVRSIPEAVEHDRLVVVVVDAQEEQSLHPRLADAPWTGAVVVVSASGSTEGPITWYNQRVARVTVGQGGTEPLGLRRLEEALVRAAGPLMVPLARSMPVFREAASRRLIRDAAVQNAVLACLLSSPGADVAAVMLNQLRLVLGLAALSGQDIGKDRLPEVATVVGLGMGLRVVGRQLVALAPGLGWLAKSALAYFSTRAVGHAAARYFRGGAPLALSRVSERVGSCLGEATT